MADLAAADDGGLLLDMDDAIQKLTEMDAGLGDIVQLRFYAGLNIDDTAQVLQVSPSTMKRDWAVARAWLFKELGGGENGS